MGREVAVCDRPDVLPSIAIDSDFDCKRIAIDMDEKQAFAALDLLDRLASVQLPAVREGTAAYLAYALACSRLPVIGPADALDLDSLLHFFPPSGSRLPMVDCCFELFNQSTNVGIADLGRLLAAAEAEAAQHRFAGTTCADIMTRNLVTVRPDTTWTEAARLFRNHAIKSLPVVEEDMTLCGLVLQSDLLAPMVDGIGIEARQQNPAPSTVADVMRTADCAVPHDLAVGVLLNRLAAQGSEVVPVERNGKLVGILTRSDVMGLLLSGAEERSAA